MKKLIFILYLVSNLSFSQDIVIPDNHSTRVMKELIDCLDGVVLNQKNSADKDHLITSSLVSVSKYYTESMFMAAIKEKSLKLNIAPEINWINDEENNCIYRVYTIKRNYRIYVSFSEEIHQAFFYCTYN
ncbi:MAG: hypothetical protein AB9834_01235 [Lentimicrobium sp.]